MGCVKSSTANEDDAAANRVRKPLPWTHDDPITSDEIRELRNVFWRNVPRFGGRPEIWRALRRAAESDLPYAQAIIDENNLRLGNPPDLTVTYDDTGFRYELPLYVLSEPSNIPGSTNTGPTRHPSLIGRIRRRRL